MRRYSLIFILTFILITNFSTNAQSGRGRPVNPSRESTPAPPPVMVPESTSIVKKEQAGNVSRFILKNGITVLIHERHAYPMVSVAAYFKAGTLQETEATKGAASLLPQVMLRGSQFRNGEQLAGEARALGCLMNAAAASPDGTAFYLITPPDKLKEALAIQADVIQHPALADEDLKREATLRQQFPNASPLLQAERGRGRENLFDLDANELAERDTAAAYSLTRLLDAAFKKSPGESHPQSVSREQLAQFYQANFRPENLVFSVVGDVTPFDALIEIQRLYAGFPPNATTIAPEASATGAVNKSGSAANPPGKSQLDTRQVKTSVKAAPKTPSPLAAPATTTNPPAAPPPEAEKTPLRYTDERGDLSQTVVSVGFRLPKMELTERASLAVLSALLSEGQGSRLARSLFIGQGVLSRVDGQLFSRADAGLLAVQMWLNPAMIDRAEAAFFREVNRLRRETPTEAEMTRARLLAEEHFVEENSDDLLRALWLAQSQDGQVSLTALNETRLRLQQVSADDVRRAADKYLTLANTIVHEYEPFTAAPRTFDAEKFAATVTNWAAGFASPVDAKQVRAAEESFALLKSQTAAKSEQDLSALESIEPLPVKNFSILNGPQAYVREDRSQPRLTLAILFQGGHLIEDETNAGITELMLRMMLYGTAKRPQAVEELEQLGAEIEIIAESDFYGLRINTLSRNAGQALKIARDLIEEPAFRDEDLVKARLEQASLLRSQRDALFSHSQQMLLQILFPNHPYGFPAHGREEALAKLTGDAVRDWYARTVKRLLPLLIIVGDTDGSALISGDTATNFRRKDPDTSMRAKVPQAIQSADKVETRNTIEAAVGAGYMGTKIGAPDAPALELLEAALNGNSGRLLAELRDKQGLVSQAFLKHQALLITGAITAQVMTTAANEQRARAALLAELDRVSKSGLSADEFKNARAVATLVALWRGHSPQRRALAYASAAFSQKPAGDVDMAAEFLSKVSAEDVKRAAAAYVKPAGTAIAIIRGTPLQK